MLCCIHCASDPAPVPTAPAKAPDWIGNEAEALDGAKGKGFYGIASVPKMENPEVQQDIADTNALEVVRKQYYEYMCTLMEAHSRSVNPEGKSEPCVIPADKTAKSDNIRDNANMIERWTDPQDGTVYSYYFLGLEPAKGMLGTMSGIEDELRKYIWANADKAFEELMQKKAGGGEKKTE
jgi:hypothetical protein